MSADNVKDELAWIFANANYAEEIVEGAFTFLAERGMVVLGPDGEPIDVRPALRAIAWVAANETDFESEHDSSEVFEALESYGIGPLLAAACYGLAAAEVEP